MKQYRHDHYTRNKYYLTRASHRHNTRSQGTRVDPTAQNISVLAKNIQGHHQENVVIDPTTGTSLEYRHLIKGPTKDIWENYFADEIFQLAQGYGTSMPSGTNNILFIPKEKVPEGRTVNNERIVSEIQPQKAETHRT